MIFFGRNTKKVNSGNDVKAILSRKKETCVFMQNRKS